MKKIIAIAAFALTACNQTAPDPDPAPEAIADPVPAPAQPPYVGFWATDLAQCNVPQEQENAPMIITAAGSDQHEAHCVFGKTEQTGPGEFRIEESCGVEGDEQKDVLEFKVYGDVLTLWPEKNATKLVRCPAG